MADRRRKTARIRSGTTRPTSTSWTKTIAASFASYIFVTQIVGGVAPLSTGIVTGTVRSEPDRLRIAELDVVLDTMTSVVFSQR